MEELEKSLIMTPNQCKAARNLLGWKQEHLSQKAEVALATIGLFERRETTPKPITLKALKAAFEKAGIEFQNDEKACGVSLRK